MKKRLPSNIKNLDELFAGARTEEPVMNIDEARSILHTKAGQPHATRSAQESIFSHPIKLFAIMTPAIGLLCLGLYLYLGKPMEQKQLTKLSEIHPHTAAKSVSEYNNEESISPVLADTLKTKRRIISNNSQYITNDSFKLITIAEDLKTAKKDRNFSQKIEKIAVFKEEKNSDSVISILQNGYNIPVRDREQVISHWDKYTDTMAINIRPQMKYRDRSLKIRNQPLLVLKTDPIAAQEQVDSFMKAVHPELKNNYTNALLIGDSNRISPGRRRDFSDKKLLYKFEGISQIALKKDLVLNEPMQIKVYIDKENLPNRVESFEEYKNDSQNVKIITIKSGDDLLENNLIKNIDNESGSKLSAVPFLELDDETLNKLGIVYNDYMVYYHGELSKDRSSITHSYTPCFPPCTQKPADTSLLSWYVMQSKLKSVKRDFFPVFTSDRMGTKFNPLSLNGKKLTSKADFLKQANSLVPVIVKTNRKTFNMEDVVFWFAPTDEFFKILPDSIGNELAKEYKKLNRNPDTSAVASKEKNPFRQNKQINGENAGDNCKYFEVCRTNSGAITNTLIYPNPASTQFNLILGLHGSRTIKISLLDIQGKLIKELAPAVLKTDGRHSYSFQIEDINRGVYLVLIESDQGEQSIQRLVVDK